LLFFFSSRRRHTSWPRDWSSDVCSSDLTLRFEVEAQRSPLCNTSAFIPRHIEHPALRHSNPASRKTRSSPSRSACAFTCCDPGKIGRASCRERVYSLDVQVAHIKKLLKY